MVDAKPEPRPQSAEQYLHYLDKEMAIMGILSTFCLAIVALSIERIVSIDSESIAYNFVIIFASRALIYLISSAISVLVAAALFYKQRSLLAWFYGQIALETALPNYTQRQLEDWLKEADSWETWIPYTCAYWILVVATVEFLLAVSATSCAMLQRLQLVYAIGTVILLLGWLFWIRRNAIKFKYEETLPYFRIH